MIIRVLQCNYGNTDVIILRSDRPGPSKLAIVLEIYQWPFLSQVRLQTGSMVQGAIDEGYM